MIEAISEEDEKEENQILKRIKKLTFYVCSKDNLIKRPREEVEIIHKILYRLIKDFNSSDKSEKKQKVKIFLVGEYKSLYSKIEK